MKEIYIDYNPKGFKDKFVSAIIYYATFIGLFGCINSAIENNYSFTFFASLLLLIFCLMYILGYIIRKTKPLLTINKETLSTHFPGMKELKIEWINVTQISIGISSLTFTTTDNKQYKVDLSNFKYTDLKEIKSSVIEICENKNIPFRNE